VSTVHYHAGGRGAAVARVLHTFGHDVVAAGLAGGAAGDIIRKDLAQSGIPVAFTGIAGESRRVLAVTDTADGRTTRFREPGPYVTTEELGRFAADYRRLLADAAAVVLCGSLPAGLPPEIYGSLASYAAQAGVPVILSAGGVALRHGAARRPGLVVPDAEGLGPGPVVSGAEGAGPARGAGGAGSGNASPGGAAGLLALGAGAVAAPMAGGVRVDTATGRWNATVTTAGPGVLSGPVPRSPGALVAGLVPGLLLGWSWPDTLRHAVAVAVAADSSGDVDLSAYEDLLDKVEVESPVRD
jgi:tagatose 6-phosphate kinase